MVSRPYRHPYKRMSMTTGAGFGKEEKRALPLRCSHHTCSRLAESDMPVVPR